MAAAASASDGPADVGSDPSGATIVPPPYPPLEPPPQGPNAKAIVALVAGELLLGLLAFPLGSAFKVRSDVCQNCGGPASGSAPPMSFVFQFIHHRSNPLGSITNIVFCFSIYPSQINPLGSITNALSAAATASVGGLGPALLNVLGISVLLTLPALLLHKVSGDTIEDMLRESLQQIFGAPDSTRRRPVLLLAISVLLSLSAGVGEEVLFRGALQPLVASLTRSDALGVGLSSLLFAVLHAATPRYLLLAFVLSVYLGWVQITSGNLLIPILVHTLFDVVGFALSLFTGKDKGKGKGKSAT